MRRRSPHRVCRATATACATVLLLAACAGESDDPDTIPSTRPVVPTSDPVEATATTPATVPATPAETEPSAPPPSASTTAPETTVAGPLPEPQVTLVEVGRFDQPVEIAVRPGDPTRYVVEQPGRVVAFTDESDDVVLDITDLTDADGERGLLGLAFHPDAPLAYVHFSGQGGDTVVAEVAVDSDTGAFDRASLREVLTVDQPYSNHNGGQLAFGPDGMLYIGLGDGGSRNDPERRALDLTSPLGKILRIDPRAAGGQPFSVPADNPFVGVDGADTTIWSYGLRNPWKFSFDPVTGDLWIADVGQGAFEEVNRASGNPGTAGKDVNFGWSAFEGFERFNDDQPTDDATPPVYVYGHDEGRCSVSGGVVARNSPVPDLDGWYVFGDYCTGEIWALDPTAPVEQPRVIPIGTLPGLAAISAGPEGDLYAVSNAGPVALIIPA